MSVDSAAMRLVVRTIRHQEHCTSLEDDAQALLRSAADELDELREKVASQRAAHKILTETWESDMEECVAETKRELEEERKRRKRVEESLSIMDRVNASLAAQATDAQLKLAIAVEALEYYQDEANIERDYGACRPFVGNQARKVLKAIRAQEEKTECTCPVGLVPGNRGDDPNCPQHGRWKR